MIKFFYSKIWGTWTFAPSAGSLVLGKLPCPFFWHWCCHTMLFNSRPHYSSLQCTTLDIKTPPPPSAPSPNHPLESLATLCGHNTWEEKWHTISDCHQRCEALLFTAWVLYGLKHRLMLRADTFCPLLQRKCCQYRIHFSAYFCLSFLAISHRGLTFLSATTHMQSPIFWWPKN